MYSRSTIKIACLTLVLSSIIFTGNALQAQIHSAHQEEGPAHKFTIAMGHAHIQEVMEKEKKSWLTIAAWALNYDYLFNSTWSIGLHNDVIFEDFTVERHHGDQEEVTLEREKPLATKLVGAYKAGKHLSFMLGIGDEITKSENLFISTAGIEYGWHMNQGWEIGAELGYDLKWHAYDTWILGFGISKVLPAKRHKKHS